MSDIPPRGAYKPVHRGNPDEMHTSNITIGALASFLASGTTRSNHEIGRVGRIVGYGTLAILAYLALRFSTIVHEQSDKTLDKASNNVPLATYIPTWTGNLDVFETVTPATLPDTRQYTDEEIQQAIIDGLITPTAGQ